MGNTIDSSPPLFCAYSLALIEEIKPDFESVFCKLDHLIDCLMEKPVDFHCVKTLITDSSQLFTKINNTTERRLEEFASRCGQLAEERDEITKSESDQKIEHKLLKRITESIKELTPRVNHCVKRKTEVCNSLKETLLLRTILEDEAKNLSWWWKLLPFGSIVASYISQSKLAKLMRERFPLQELINKNMEEMNTLKGNLDGLIAEKALIQDKIQRRAVELESQTERMVEGNEERDLILEGVSQFLDIDHFVRTLSAQLKLAEIHFDMRDEKDVYSCLYYLLEFLSTPKCHQWLQMLVRHQLLDKVHQKANHLKNSSG